VFSFVATEYLRRTLQGNVRVVYFYYQFQDRFKQSTEEVLACLLKQLVLAVDPLPSCLLSQYQNFTNSHEPLARPDLSCLLDLFLQCSSYFDRVFVMIDAFDECGQIERQREKIVSALRSLSESLKVFITTQPHLLGDLTSEHSSTTLQIRADKTDIEKYVRSNLPKRVSKQLENDIITTICAESDGMYTAYDAIANS
jgi:hypothetical protein